ncbi:MAG: DUF58 domain-containing protein [Deltaproteobacteria bacterium]|nr:DUF58 domain-containing protein [Deltaproteobacteria bacterium]
MTTDLYQDREPTIFNSLLICFFVLISLFVALLHRQYDLSLLAILVLLLMGGSKVWSLVSLSRVSCSTSVDKKRVFPGETLTLATTIENAKFLPVWVHIRWPQHRIFGTLDEAVKIPHEAGLMWYQRARFSRRLVALRRGLYQAGPSHIQTSDLFGFFKSEKKFGETTQIIVYPKLVPLKTVLLPRHDLFGTPGYNSPVKDPVYIMGTRDYQPSSPSRHIHWKASARHVRLQEKIFEPSQQGKNLIALDVSAFEKNALKDAFEHTLETIASLSLRLDEMGSAVGFITNGITQGGEYSMVPMGRGPQQIPAILEALARLRMKPKAKLSHIMHKIPGPLRGSNCAFFSCENGAEPDEMRIFCKHRNIPITMFAWRRNPVSGTVEYPEDADVHLIKTIRNENGDA